jgi:hypothetical protein
VQIITSSIEFNTGSTRNGALSTNTHQFTGSVLMSGSLGIGVVPSTWYSNFRGLDLTNGSLITYSTNGSLFLTQNAYFNAAGAWTYTNTGTAGQYSIDGTGNHVFSTVASGTGGTSATLTTRLYVSSSGNVGIGTNAPSQLLEVVGGEIKAGRVDSSNEGGQVSFGRASDNATGWYIDSYGNAASTQLRFVDVTNAVVAMTITGSNVGIGTASPNEKLHVSGNISVVSSSGSKIGFNTTDAFTALGTSVPQYGMAYGWSTQPLGLSGYYGLAFFSTGTERMRITSGGLILINTSVGTSTLNLKSQTNNKLITSYNPSGGDGTIYVYGTSTSLDYAFNTYSVGNAFYLYNNGNYSFAGSNVSDKRLKENIKNIDYNATEKLMQLVPKSYNMINHPDTKRSGFIAQEVKEILPDLITGTETNEEYLGLDYNGLLSIAVKAIQELKSENDTLKEILQRNNIQ